MVSHLFPLRRANTDFRISFGKQTIFAMSKHISFVVQPLVDILLAKGRSDQKLVLTQFRKMYKGKHVHHLLSPLCKLLETQTTHRFCWRVDCKPETRTQVATEMRWTFFGFIDVLPHLRWMKNFSHSGFQWTVARGFQKIRIHTQDSKFNVLSGRNCPPTWNKQNLSFSGCHAFDANKFMILFHLFCFTFASEQFRALTKATTAKQQLLFRQDSQSVDKQFQNSDVSVEKDPKRQFKQSTTNRTTENTIRKVKARAQEEEMQLLLWRK